MRRIVVKLVLIVLAAVLAGCASTDPTPRVTRDDVVELARAGADARWIIERLHETGTVLALTASDIVRMRDAGVPTEVLDWMQATHIQEIRRREAMIYGSPFGPCGWPPRQVYHPRFGWRFAPWPGC
jgi:hypothetical protein